MEKTRKITLKEFKEGCDAHLYKGRNFKKYKVYFGYNYENKTYTYEIYPFALTVAEDKRIENKKLCINESFLALQEYLLGNIEDIGDAYFEASESLIRVGNFKISLNY